MQPLISHIRGRWYNLSTGFTVHLWFPEFFHLPAHLFLVSKNLLTPILLHGSKGALNGCLLLVNFPHSTESVQSVAYIILYLPMPSGDAQAIAGCYATMDCSGPQVSDSGTVDAESCCIADTPLSYMPSGGGACMPCQGISYTNSLLIFIQKVCYKKYCVHNQNIPNATLLYTILYRTSKNSALLIIRHPLPND